MDTKTASTREACKRAALGILAARDDLRGLQPWTTTRLPSDAKRSLNEAIADWVARNEPPLAEHEHLAALIRAEDAQVGETRYQIRLAMAHHLRAGWSGAAAAAPGAAIAAGGPPASAPPSGSVDVETLVRQALAEQDSPDADDGAPAPPPAPPAEEGEWECGLCGLRAVDQEALVAHVADCNGVRVGPEAEDGPTAPESDGEGPAAGETGTEPTPIRGGLARTVRRGSPSPAPKPAARKKAAKGRR
jgi:hypothetical protein